MWLKQSHKMNMGSWQPHSKPEQTATAMMKWGFRYYSNHLLPCLCFSAGNALLVYPVMDKEAKAVSVLLPGSEEVRMIQSCSAFSAHRYILYSNLSAPHLKAVPHQQFCATLSLPFPQDGTVIHSYTDYLAAAKWKKGRNLVKKVQKGKEAWGLALETNESSEGKCETAELCDCTNGP